MIEPVDGGASGRFDPEGLLRVRVRHGAPAGGFDRIALTREEPDGLGQPQGQLFHLLNIWRLDAAGVGIGKQDLLRVGVQIHQTNKVDIVGFNLNLGPVAQS